MATTLQTLTDAIMALARANGETDKDIKDRILTVKTNMLNVSGAIEETATSLEHIPDSIATANGKIAAANAKITEVSTTINNLNTNSVNSINVPVISSNNKVIAGHPITFTVSASSRMQNVKIDRFTASLAGEQTQTAFAVNNTASFVFNVAANTPTNSALLFSVTAYDELDNKITATKTVVVTTAYVNKPTITSPANNTNVIKTDGFTVTSSTFGVTGTSDTHVSSSWKMTSDNTGNTIVASKLDSIVDLTRHTFTASKLTALGVGQYYLWVKYKGADLGESAWSTAVPVMLLES